MLESLGKIPKGVNIIVFIWAMIGLVLLLRDPKIRREKLFYIGLLAVGFMVAWRVLFRITTSRYAAGLILPFIVLASYFLYDSGKRRHWFVRLVLYTAIACTGIIVLKMNLDSVTRNESAVAVAEVFRNIDGNRGNRMYMFRAPWKDFRRIYYFSRMDGNILGVYDVPKLILNYSEVYVDTVLNVEARAMKDDALASGVSENAVWDKLKRDGRLIASVVEESNAKKKQLVYLLSSGNQCVPVLKDRILPYRPNLLDNGDLEDLDTPEESREKLEAHLGEYALFPDGADPAARTPRAAYFSVKSGSASIPEVGVRGDFPIDGNNSARIRIPGGTAFLMFDRRFSNGTYEYSALVQGEKGTMVRILYEVCKDGSRETRSLAMLRIPDKRVFLIKAHFSVDDLGQNDYFQAGASVQNGEAYLDDFSLTQAVSGASAGAAFSPED